ncbi:MAG: hypothetical protein H5T59_08865 [Anaerolineae bacterium]|nr:hypothetical protein [Anaerolineae bacterium]
MSQLRIVAELMAIAATTAPKAKGENFVITAIVEGEDLKRLAEAMQEHGRALGKPQGWERDAKNVLQSDCVVLIGIKDARVSALNCSACGAEQCIRINTYEGEFRGPQCAWRLVDLGIAVGSAVKLASLLNVDNRVMYRIGVGARRCGLTDADVVLGIPLSATGKSPYFDRPPIT